MLVSDGGDNSSTHKPGEVMPTVRESRATIYTIGISDPDDHEQNPALLRQLAHVSGGEAFFPENLSEVVGICGQIASDIRTRYTIGYVPIRSGEQGALRKIQSDRVGARRAQVGGTHARKLCSSAPSARSL